MREGWTYKRLEDVCSIDYGTRVVQKKDKGTKYYVYGGGGATFMVDSYNREDCFIVSRFAMSPKCTRFVKGKFFLNDSGLSVRTKTSTLSQDFVDKALLANNDTIYSFGKGMAQRNLDMPSFRSLVIPIPSLAEQERIVVELDLLTGIIDKQKVQLKELDTLAQSIFYDMFGDPVENEKGWETKQLNSIIHVKGRVGWKGYKKEDLRDSGPLTIGGGHITDSGEIDLSNPVFLSQEKYEESPEIMIETGDLILVQRGTIGKVGLIKYDIGQATINPCVLILRPYSINNVYALHFFLSKSMQDCLIKFVRGVAQPMITQQQVNSISVPVPPLSLQQSFAQKIQSIESQKASINRSIAETQKLFDYTMDKYFG